MYIIESIVANSYSGYNYHLPDLTTSYDEILECGGESCWSNTIDDNGAKHGTVVSGLAISGVVSSLVKKGYVQSSSTSRDAVTVVTRSGWEAYQIEMAN